MSSGPPTCRSRRRDLVASQVADTGAVSAAEGNDNYGGQVGGRACPADDKNPAQRDNFAESLQRLLQDVRCASGDERAGCECRLCGWFFAAVRPLPVDGHDASPRADRAAAERVRDGSPERRQRDVRRVSDKGSARGPAKMLLRPPACRRHVATGVLNCQWSCRRSRRAGARSCPDRDRDRCRRAGFRQTRLFG
jgi:hypothetical protein